MTTSWTDFSLPPPVRDVFPRVKWLLEKAVAAHLQSLRLSERLADLGYVPSGGGERKPAHQPQIAELIEQLELSETAEDGLWEELERHGAIVSDRERGLVDFAVIIDGRAVLLCYQHGEPVVNYWHELFEDCERRRPIEVEHVVEHH